MSYLGGSIAFLWGLVQTWTGRANNAWGSSRVWNSGTSWESAYNSEVTAATDPGSSADSWTDHLSRLWSATANLWHGAYNSEVTAYNNALAPAAVDHLAASAASPRTNVLTTTASITADRTGQWAVMARCDCNDTSFGNNDDTEIHLIVNAVDVGSTSITYSGGGSHTGIPLGVLWQGTMNSGQVASVQVRASDGSGGSRNATGYVDAYFIPTQANPH